MAMPLELASFPPITKPLILSLRRVDDKDRLDLDDLSLFGKFGNQRRVECGWKIGVAFFSGMWSFNIDGTIGMTNLMTNGTRFRESRGSVSLTRYF